jgi:hypothetical protein
MNVTTPADAKLTETLTSLEQSLLSPLVPGEILKWTQNVQEAASALASDLETLIRTVLHVQYDEILRNAPEMCNRITKLKEAEEQLICQTREFVAQLEHFRKIVDRVDPQKVETVVERERENCIQQGLALILGIRQQKAACDTWYTEAQLRDIGEVD